MKPSRLHTALWLLMLSACTSKPALAPDSEAELFARLEAEQVRELRWLDTANPKEAARAAVLKQDRRLIELCTYGCSIPATPETQYQSLVGNGTSRLHLGDVVFGAEHERLYRKAQDYAEQYNREIQRLASQ